MDLSTLSIDFSSVLAMGLMVVSVYAAIWAINRVLFLSMDDWYSSLSKSDQAREQYKIRESLYAEGWTDAEWRIGVKDTF